MMRMGIMRASTLNSRLMEKCVNLQCMQHRVGDLRTRIPDLGPIQADGGMQIFYGVRLT
jgi:hypothetical protein